MHLFAARAVALLPVLQSWTGGVSPDGLASVAVISDFVGPLTSSGDDHVMEITWAENVATVSTPPWKWNSIPKGTPHTPTVVRWGLEFSHRWDEEKLCDVCQGACRYENNVAMMCLYYGSKLNLTIQSRAATIVPWYKSKSKSKGLLSRLQHQIIIMTRRPSLPMPMMGLRLGG